MTDWFSGKVFRAIHGNNLVYNTCWEDPRVDREALNLNRQDRVMMITSAGCNALDYLLDEPEHIHCVDMNPRQNYLMELKIGAIRALDFETFFQLFGCGQLDSIQSVYQKYLRSQLSVGAREYWDRNHRFFDGKGWRSSFYYRGTSGLVAKFIGHYIDYYKLRDCLEAIFNVDSLVQQRQIYYDYLYEEFWSKPLKWFTRQETVMSMVGVPRSQMRQIETGYVGGLAKFIEDCIEAVFTNLPLRDNYFWWLYINGAYDSNRCPEYLKEENFEKLKSGLIDRVSTHTSTITDFLGSTKQQMSKYILLDHMDWLSYRHKHILQNEWQAILNRASNNAQMLWRSAGLFVDFVNPLVVSYKGEDVQLGEVLQYDNQLALELHKKDRVHTYGSFYIANLSGAMGK